MEVLSTEDITENLGVESLFERYMQMPKRSLDKLAKATGKPLPTLCSWSRKYKWQERAKVIDSLVTDEVLRELANQKRKELVKRIKQSIVARDRANANALRLLERLMKDHEPDILKNIQATQKAVEIVGLNQLACHHELPGGTITGGETASDDSSAEELQALPFEAGHVQSEDSTAQTILEQTSPDLCGNSEPADTDDSGSSG